MNVKHPSSVSYKIRLCTETSPMLGFTSLNEAGWAGSCMAALVPSPSRMVKGVDGDKGFALSTQPRYSQHRRGRECVEKEGGVQPLRTGSGEVR